MATKGTGSAFTFSGYTANILTITWSGLTKATIDTTHMGTTTARTCMEGDLYEPGEVTLEHEWDVATVPITSGTTALTIQFGSSTNNKWSCNAFLSGFEITDNLEERMTASATFKPVGAITQ